ncbi:MAG: helix-turn-helix transcriptional regulator [Ruminiclostridium sp.]|nr:helix-turn-helix transcriptional regulator [Ruminiclostridium sp.]MBQ8410615.1 helix-turn-helix transcriptional regulator [Ruminiclostridium sp.]MBQ8842024.1 helix-turn-helix transcriptional regulator [Ruminiclostridium sp.]
MKTIDLEAELSRLEKFDPSFIDDNKAPDFYSYIDTLIKERNVKRSELIKGLNLDRNYGYQILNGTRVPTKEIIIKIGLYLSLSIEDIQRLLKICGRECLYARNMTDAKVLYSVYRKFTYKQAVAFIFEKDND